MKASSGAVIVGAFEHPRREIPELSTAAIHAEVCRGALRDAGLSIADVDGFFCDRSLSNSPASLMEYLGLGEEVAVIDATDTGGSSYLLHVGHAVAAIDAGACSVALVTMAGRSRSERTGTPLAPQAPEFAFEHTFGTSTLAEYAMVARRHMLEFGTTSEQLAEVRAVASTHASYNPHALLRDPVSAAEVLASPLVSDPLHRLDCCITTDGGGAVVLVSAERARSLGRGGAVVLGQGEAAGYARGGYVDLTTSAGRRSGQRAFAQAGLRPADVGYASIYDSFTITLLMALEDLGFCPKGEGGPFVASGALRAPHGALPVNTDGGGLCSNHPGRRGGMARLIEAVRQIRGAAASAVQVPDLEVALVHGTGGSLGSRHISSTVLLGRLEA